MKLQDAIEQYIQFLNVRRYSKRTVSGMKRSLERFERYLMRVEKSHFDIERISTSDIDDYARYLSEYRDIKTAKPLGESRLKALLMDVRRFFRFLKEHNHVRHSPAEHIELGKPVEVAPKGLMTKEEVLRILAQPDTATSLGLRDRVMLELLYGCGIRASEFIQLDVSDIDLEKAFVLIRSGKGAKDRVVPIADTVCVWLERYLEFVRPCFVTAGPGTSALWLIEKGTRLGKASLARIILKYKKAANIKKPGMIHAFRHSIATHLLDAGLDIRYIQEFLGHEHIRGTERYTSVAVAGLAKILEKNHPRVRMKIAVPVWCGE